MIKKISFSGIMLASLLFITTSCEKWLDVNDNIDGPAYVPGYLYLAGIEQNYQGLYFDIRAIAPMVQMMGTSTTNFTNFPGHYYQAGNDAGGELWRMTYWLQGKNLENMINQSEEEGRWNLAGIGYIMKAFSWDQLTKYHGEVILEDAFIEKLLTHDYDYQPAVYAAVKEWAYKGIKYLQRVDTSAYGTEISANDYIYQGDKAKWIKFAYGIMARNLVSLSNKTNFNTDYAQDVIKFADSSFTSYLDDATLKVGGGGSAAAQSAYNNFWGTVRGNLSRSNWQHEYAVQLLTGSVPVYDPATGNKPPMVPANTYYPFQLAVPQIICDTIITVVGHYDPRVAVKLGTKDDATYLYMDNARSIQKRKY
ncbi:MAG: SusD/RagB family nutrient-binding outer membrane lipoprotein, partial [Bacteroidales bacterium]|nr:SusD/RagB family nutrient-binding outer membrane lipoprotein [Bacteroidales bacterium]